jgi:hypothetical protein
MTEKSPEKAGPQRGDISLAGDVEGKQEDGQDGHDANRGGHGSNEIPGVPHAASAQDPPNLKRQVDQSGHSKSQHCQAGEVVDGRHGRDSTREGVDCSAETPACVSDAVTQKPKSPKERKDDLKERKDAYGKGGYDVPRVVIGKQQQNDLATKFPEYIDRDLSKIGKGVAVLLKEIADGTLRVTKAKPSDVRQSTSDLLATLQREHSEKNTGANVRYSPNALLGIDLKERRSRS